MPYPFSDKQTLQDIYYDNLDALRLFADYLNLRPRFVSGERVLSLTKEGFEEKEAVYALLLAGMGLDPDAGETERRLAHLYIKANMHILPSDRYGEDPYLKRIVFPSVTSGDWTFRMMSYAPYELFVCGDMQTDDTLRAYVQTAMYREAVSYPAVLQNGREWMTVTPNEIETMQDAISQAHGRVVAFGLGLGYYAYMASEKEEVTSVTVIERDRTVIKLFRSYLLPQYPHAEKIRIIEGDAYEYAERYLPGDKADTVFFDIWHDTSDGVPAYKRLCKCEHACPHALFSYWIEPSLLSFIRNERLPHLLRDPSLTASDIRAQLSDTALRTSLRT